MATPIMVTERETALTGDVRVRPIKGFEILEALPSRRIPHRLVNPFIIVHEGVVPSRRTHRQAARPH